MWWIVGGGRRAVTSFVDDVAKKTVCKRHEAEEVERQSRRAHEELDSMCAPTGGSATI